MSNLPYQTSFSMPLTTLAVISLAMPMVPLCEIEKAPLITDRRVNPGIGLAYLPGNAVTTNHRLKPHHIVEALGWNTEETLETYLRLRTFAADWDYPGMEVYDDV
jgi:hypothetical protein